MLWVKLNFAAQHTLLILRERALVEKTSAELAWLEQQKQSQPNKGADDQHPDFLRKKKNILRRHHQRHVGVYDVRSCHGS